MSKLFVVKVFMKLPLRVWLKVALAPCPLRRSSDGSVRLWDFDWQTDPLKNASRGHLLNKQGQSGNSLVKYTEQDMRSWMNSFAWE